MKSVKRLIAVNRVQDGKGTYDTGTVLPEYDLATQKSLIDCGAARYADDGEELVEAKVVEPTLEQKQAAEDAAGFDSLVQKGAASREQIAAICGFWEIKSFGEFKTLSETELTEVKGVGKATALKILEAVV